MSMKKQHKAIFEYSEDECKTHSKELKSENNALQTEFNNNTVKMVYGEVMSVPMVFKGEKTTVEEFVETEEFEKLVDEGVENYGVFCANVFEDGELNDQMVAKMCKNMGLSKQIFWKTVWKQIKIRVNENKLDQIEKRMGYLRELKEKEKKVGDK